MTDVGKTQVIRLRELGNREATVLENSKLRVMIDDLGSMTPEMSARPETGGKGVNSSGNPTLNAHWLPWFRSNSGKPFRDAEDGAFWKANLLYNIAGSFPCLPNFGPGHIINGINMPPHGWTANLPWFFRGGGNYDGVSWALSSLESPESAMPLSFRKIDAIIPEQNIHYSSISVKNTGEAGVEICAGWHNTVGAPFLAEGAKLSVCADAWVTAPNGSEFDATSRFVPGAEFASLKEAPLLNGGKADLSAVPGPIGYTDFASGRVPANSRLGWSSVVNPGLKMAYICFFTGPAAAGGDDIILRFNDLWMQYGGRPFTPWAPYEGGTDLTYCLGTENAAGAFAQGLEYSKQARKVLGTPVTALIPGGEEKFLRYATLFAPYGENALDGGVSSIDMEENALVCGNNGAFWRFDADLAFGVLKALEKNIKV